MNKKIDNGTLEMLFEIQKYFQNSILRKTCPEDNINEFSTQLVHMVSELGEVTQEDTRWKNNNRTKIYDEESKERKLNELADVFIICVNLFLFSGFDSEEAYEAIKAKMLNNIIR